MIFEIFHQTILTALKQITMLNNSYSINKAENVIFQVTVRNRQQNISLQKNKHQTSMQ